MLKLLVSNRYDVLADRLVAQIGAHADSVFAGDTVIVPSTAVRRELTLRIAAAQGICANVGFHYLAQWLWQRLAPRVGPPRATMPFARERLEWRIHAAFGDRRWTRAHPRLAGFLGAADERMRHALAQRVAARFEQLLVDRPDWADAWTQGRGLLPGAEGVPHPDAAWQAALWRRLVAEAGAPPSQAALLDAVAATTAADWPALVHVFALPAIAPAHLVLLQAIAQRCAVTVYAPNPCREYWFDLVGPAQLAALVAGGRIDHHETGHPLLASWGGPAQVHLAALGEAADETEEDFRPAGGATLLARLQDSLLELRPPAPGAWTLADDDRSLELHLCHSPVRELEVLHDRLLDLFAGADPPAPADVLVVLPDLDAAAPLIDAVFGTMPRERFVPYTITGRARSGVSAPAKALLALLALVDGRAPASEVAGLLGLAPVARRFGLGDGGLARLREGLRDAGVHWAVDAAHRAALGLPAEARHSLAEGVQRLAGRGAAGPEFEALQAFAARLAALRAAVAVPRRPAEWPAILGAAIDDFVDVRPDELDELAELRGALAALAAEWDAAAFAEPLSLGLVREVLAERLDAPARGGVPTGAVTFSAISSLRGLPYRVVCILGLAADAFPGASRADEWDLVAAFPRRSDRDRRRDERNLFLDLVLAARDVLHLSATGRSVRDNRPLPLSVLADELLEFLLPALGTDADTRAAARRRLVVEHPLQPFDERRFVAGADPRWASFDAEIAQAQRERLRSAVPAALPDGGAIDDAAADDTADEDTAAEDDDSAVEAAGAAPFIAGALAPAPLPPLLAAARLEAFLAHPSRLLLRERLGLVLPRPADELDDDEPFVADRRARLRLADALAPAIEAGAEAAVLRRRAREAAGWPAGAVGDAALEAELPTLRAWLDTLRRLGAGGPRPPLPLRVALPGGPPLDGLLEGLHACGLLRPRYDDLGARELTGAWLAHLQLCAAAPPGVACTTHLVGRERSLRLRPVDDAPARLAELAALLQRGLAEPLPFFPRSAWAFVDGGGSTSRALAAWRGHARGGERDDPWVRQLLRGRPDPLEHGFERFAAIAQAVFGPLREALEEAAP